MVNLIVGWMELRNVEKISNSSSVPLHSSKMSSMYRFQQHGSSLTGLVSKMVVSNHPTGLEKKFLERSDLTQRKEPQKTCAASSNIVVCLSCDNSRSLIVFW